MSAPPPPPAPQPSAATSFASNNPYNGVAQQQGSIDGTNPNQQLGTLQPAAFAAAAPLNLGYTVPRHITFPIGQVTSGFSGTGDVRAFQLGTIGAVTANARNHARASIANLVTGPTGLPTAAIRIDAVSTTHNVGNWAVYACIAPSHATAPTTFDAVWMRPGSLALVGGSGLGPVASGHSVGAPPPMSASGLVYMPDACTTQLFPPPVTEIRPVLYVVVFSAGSGTRVMVRGSFTIICEGVGYGTWDATTTWPALNNP